MSHHVHSLSAWLRTWISAVSALLSLKIARQTTSENTWIHECWCWLKWSRIKAEIWCWNFNNIVFPRGPFHPEIKLRKKGSSVPGGGPIGKRTQRHNSGNRIGVVWTTLACIASLAVKKKNPHLHCALSSARTDTVSSSTEDAVLHQPLSKLLFHLNLNQLYVSQKRCSHWTLKQAKQSQFDCIIGFAHTEPWEIVITPAVMLPKSTFLHNNPAGRQSGRKKKSFWWSQKWWYAQVFHFATISQSNVYLQRATSHPDARWILMLNQIKLYIYIYSTSTNWKKKDSVSEQVRLG